MSRSGLQFPVEIEGKYRVDQVDMFLDRLQQLSPIEKTMEEHEDHYLRHPCRDFRITDEALRMRCVNQRWHVTYKGPRSEGALKIRPEIEFPLAEGTQEDLQRVWQALGFEPVAVVRKTRRVFSLEGFHQGMHVTVDQVESLGSFAELECVVHDETALREAERAIESLAIALQLGFVEKRSYLSMLLELQR
jgi:adenylate cyclase class 2